MLLGNRWLELVGLQVYWKQYEGKVKEFLSWVMDEAKRFSSEVTSGDGEKGVADHMESCKVKYLSDIIMEMQWDSRAT